MSRFVFGTVVLEVDEGSTTVNRLRDTRWAHGDADPRLMAINYTIP